jgi:CRP-like cAMP-binding protein
MDDDAVDGVVDKLPDKGLLAEIDPEIRDRLAKVGRFETMRPGTRVTTQGETHHALSILISGKLSVTCHAHGDLIKLATLEAGQSVGEMGVIDPQKASADVTVIERPARLWTIDGDAFDQFLEDDPRSGLAIMKVLASVLCDRIRHDSETMLRRAETIRDSFFDMDY